jgi:hypothetical protein
MFGLPNLVSQSVEPCRPWEFSSPIPESVRGKENKKARDRWINHPDTQHQCYSAFEGFVGNARIAEPKNGSEGNPPFKLHAFVADIDAPVSQEELTAGIGRIEFAPNYYERTLSGNARLVWLFEQPVAFPNRRFAVEFLTLTLARMRLEQVAAGFDKPAFLEPNRYYTNSCDWWTLDEKARIPYSLLQGWVVEVSEKHVWRKDRGAIDIPLPVVFAEIEKKWPQNNWPGDFVEGAQGPSFWVEGSASPKSAIVKPTGMFTFSAHAVKPFYSWADLLGQAFVEKHAAEMMGKAVEGIYHDGTKYWRKDGYGDYKWFAKEDIASHLAVDRGLNPVKDGSTPSEVSRAVQYIQNWQGVVGAAPFVFQPTGIVMRNGFKFLNTHTRRVLAPSSEKAVWGPHGNMPFLSQFFDGFFHPESQPVNPKDYYLAWLARFYRGAYELNLESGQNVFILGGPGIGKTFLNQGLLPHLMGGAEDAESYLLGTTDFNSQLFEVGLWTVDDNSATVDNITHRKFSAMVKKMAANTCFAYHAKFRVPCTVEWRGRVQITANDDEESARIVPDLSITILDKLKLFRAAKVPPVEFPNRRGCDDIIRREGPVLARWLLDWEIPSALVGTSRFGVVSYHEKSLLITAEQSSQSAGFREMLEHWRAAYFSEHKDVEAWEGSAFDLLVSMCRDEAAQAAGVRTITPQGIGRQLATLKAKGYPITTSGHGDIRSWRIPAPAATHAATLPVGNKFQKHA